jgi:hypothetical protein
MARRGGGSRSAVSRDPLDSTGGLTGATGELTPDDPDAEFVPAERREMSNPRRQADVTESQARRAEAQHGEVGNPEAQPEGGPTNLATRDMGNASEHGLSPDDPAYRMEFREPMPRSTDEDDDAPPRTGGDRVSDEEERF